MTILDLWDEPVADIDPDEPAPILKTTIHQTTPFETFEERLARDTKTIAANMKGVAA